MLPAINIGSHDVIVGAIKQDLTEKLYGLTLGHVTVGLHQDVVVLVEEEFKVCVQVSWYKILVACQEFLQ